MASIERWNPVKELDRLRLEFDSLLEHFGMPHRTAPGEAQAAELRPAVDTFTDGELFFICVELPGVDPNALDIKVADNLLVIRGVREERRAANSLNYYRRELRHGPFQREVRLPPGLKADELKANYRDGILELCAPMPSTAMPKQIKIQIKERATEPPPRTRRP